MWRQGRKKSISPRLGAGSKLLGSAKKQRGLALHCGLPLYRSTELLLSHAYLGVE